MDKIIIIDDSGIQRELEKFLLANKDHIRLSSDMDEVSLAQNPILKEIVKRYEQKHKVKIQSKDHVRFYKLNDIIHLKSIGTKTILYQSDHNQIEINESLNNIELQLQHFPFFKTHQIHIVNLHHLVKIADKPEVSIELSNGDIVPVTASKKKTIIEFLDKYIS